MRTTCMAAVLAAIGMAAAGCSWGHDSDRGASGGSGASSGSMSGSDSAFVRDVASGGMAELEMSRLASSKGASMEVRTYADRLVNDHTAANAELQILASRRGMAVPATVTREQRGHIDDLAKMSGTDFDRRYISMMIDDHKATIAKFENESKNGSDSGLRDFASKTLPTLREHLRMAQDIAGRVGAGMP